LPTFEQKEPLTQTATALFHACIHLSITNKPLQIYFLINEECLEESPTTTTTSSSDNYYLLNDDKATPPMLHWTQPNGLTPHFSSPANSTVFSRPQP